MADVFISYSSADRPYAEAIAAALEQEGWSVWWDRKIRIGDEFDEELERQLAAARSVVVLWSEDSVRSKWVRDEAAEGLSKKSLFPATLEPVALPFGYRRVQTADLLGWEPGQAHSGLEQLLAGLRQKLSASGRANAQSAARPVVAPNRVVQHWRRRPWFRILFPGLLALLVGVAALVIMQIRPAVRIQADLKVERLRWLVGGQGETPALASLGFSSLNIDHFSSVSFAPKTLILTNPSVWDRPGRDAIRQRKRVVPVPDMAVFVAGDRALQPAVAIDSSEPATFSIGTVDALRPQPGTWVTLKWRDKWRDGMKALEITMEDSPLSLVATVVGPFWFYARYVTAEGIPAEANRADLLAFAETREDDPPIRVTGSSEGLTLVLGLAVGNVVDLLPKSGAPITKVELDELSTDGQWESTLATEGYLSFVDYPMIQPVRVEKTHLIRFDRLCDFFITGLSLDPKSAGLNLRLEGEVGNISIKGAGMATDPRPTLFDAIRTRLNLLFTLVSALGIVSGIFSLYQGYRELRG